MPSEQTGQVGSNEGQWLIATQVLGRFRPAAGTGVSTDAANEAPLRYGFTVGKVALLMRSDCMSEVVKPPPIYPIPNTPPWLSGILNLRGNLVPVFDLRPRYEWLDGVDAARLVRRGKSIPVRLVEPDRRIRFVRR